MVLTLLCVVGGSSCTRRYQRRALRRATLEVSHLRKESNAHRRRATLQQAEIETTQQQATRAQAELAQAQDRLSQDRL